MAFSKEMESAMEDPSFVSSLNNISTEAEMKETFSKKGIDYDKEFSDDASGELDAEALDNVSGGFALTAAAIIAVAPFAWKAGSMAGVVIRSAYDAKRYGNPFRTYSKSTVKRAMSYFEP